MQMTKPTPKKIISTLLPIVVILLIGVFYLYYHPESRKINFSCPESYTTEDEYTVALRNYINEEIANNPNITAEELARKRYEALVANNCIITLQNLRDHLPPGSGTTSTDIINNLVRSYNTTP